MNQVAKLEDKMEAIVSAIYHSYMVRKTHIDSSLSDQYTRSPGWAQALYQACSVADVNTTSALVTGSKGKGTVSKLAEALVRGQGLKTGLFTSPHQLCYTERIRVNGDEVSVEDFVRLGQGVQESLTNMEDTIPLPQYMGPMAGWLALALRIFQDQETEVNILECGRGARFDDVAVVKAQAAAINTIFDEHLPYLGQTDLDVAWHKAGIIQDSMVGVVVARQSPEVLKVIKDEASLKGVPLLVVGQDLQAEVVHPTEEGWVVNLVTPHGTYTDVSIKGLPTYAIDNGLMALALAEILCGGPLDHQVVMSVFEDFSFAGCMERLEDQPPLHVDGCIHRVCAQAIVETLGRRYDKPAVYVLGIPDNKDIAGVLASLVPHGKAIICTMPDRCHLPFSDLPMTIAKANGYEKVELIPNTADALKRARHLSGGELPLVLLGTQIWVGQARQIVESEQ